MSRNSQFIDRLLDLGCDTDAAIWEIPRSQCVESHTVRQFGDGTPYGSGFGGGIGPGYGTTEWSYHSRRGGDGYGFGYHVGDGRYSHDGGNITSMQLLISIGAWT